MAVTATLLENFASTTNSTSYETASYSPSADKSLLACVANSRADSTEADVPSSLSGNGLTWTRVGTLQATRDGGTQTRKVTLWKASTGSSPTSGTLTVSFPATQAGCIVHVIELSGADNADLIVQDQSGNGTGDTTPDITLASALQSGSATFGALLLHTTDTIAPGSSGSYTELAENNHSGPTTQLQTQLASTGNTLIDWTLGAAVNSGMIGVEIRVASSGTSKTQTDSLGLTDSPTQTSTYSRTHGEALGLTDSPTQTSTYSRTPTEPVGLTDNLSTLLSISKQLNDPSNITDTISTTALYSRTISDSLGMTDGTTVAEGILVTITDTLGLVDSYSYTRDISFTITNTLTLSDELSASSGSTQATITDALGLTDTGGDQLTTYTYNVTITDPASILDQNNEQITIIIEVNTDDIDLYLSPPVTSTVLNSPISTLTIGHPIISTPTITPTTTTATGPAEI